MQPQIRRFSHTILPLLIIMLGMAVSSAIFLFISKFWGKPTQLINSYSPVWISASQGAPASLVKQAASFDTTGKIDAKAIKVIAIPSNGAGKLYLFDFRSPQLCGVGGCVYLLYHESGKLMLELTANPHVPPQEKLIAIDKLGFNSFPCIVFTQTTDIENMVSRTKYCYQGKYFDRFSDDFTVVSKTAE